MTIWDWQDDILQVDVSSDDLGLEWTPATLVGPGACAPYMTEWTIDVPNASPEAVGAAKVWVRVRDSKMWGEHWFMNLLPEANSKYQANIDSFFDVFFEVSECPMPVIEQVDPDTGCKGAILTGARVIGSNFTDGDCLDVTFQMTGQSDIIATNVLWNSATEIEFDVDLTTAAAGWWDVKVTNGCCTIGILEDALNVIDKVYYTTFDGTDDPASNWSRTSTSYWACLWFQGQICDSNASCTVYGTPHFYAWRTQGFTVPSCWNTGSNPIVLTMEHSQSKQETYYDRSRVEYSTVSASGPWLPLAFYDHAYASHGWWDGSFSQRTIHANLTWATPGNMFWLRFDSYSLDSWGNSASGWHIYQMTID